MKYSSFTTSQQLRDACAHNNIPLHFIGFKDQLHKTRPYNGAYIVNMQNSFAGNGTHWVAFVLTDKNAFYFDSFQAYAPIEIEHFFRRRGYTSYRANNMDIQNIESGGCGEYCIVFLNFMYNNLPRYRYTAFLKLWNTDPDKNLKVLKKML